MSHSLLVAKGESVALDKIGASIKLLSGLGYGGGLNKEQAKIVSQALDFVLEAQSWMQAISNVQTMMARAMSAEQPSSHTTTDQKKLLEAVFDCYEALMDSLNDRREGQNYIEKRHLLNVAREAIQPKTNK